MYRRLIRRRIEAGFDALSAGDYTPAVARLAPDVHHVFEGDHALGGARHSRAAVELWFARLWRLCPRITFTADPILDAP